VVLDARSARLSEIAQQLVAHDELRLAPCVLEQLERISVSAVRRRLKAFARLDQWQLPRRKGTKPPNPVTRSVPMKRIPWDEQESGHFRVDLVHHSGSILRCGYVHTVHTTGFLARWIRVMLVHS